MKCWITNALKSWPKNKNECILIYIEVTEVIFISSMTVSLGNTKCLHDSTASLLYDLISLSHACEGILIPSLQHCFSSLTFLDIHLCTTIWRSHRSISRIWTLTRSLQNLNSHFSGMEFQICWCFGSLSCCMTQCQPRFSCWKNLALENSGIQGSSWFSPCWLQNPRLSALHHHGWWWVWGSGH